MWLRSANANDPASTASHACRSKRSRPIARGRWISYATTIVGIPNLDSLFPGTEMCTMFVLSAPPGTEARGNEKVRGEGVVQYRCKPLKKRIDEKEMKGNESIFTASRAGFRHAAASGIGFRNRDFWRRGRRICACRPTAVQARWIDPIDLLAEPRILRLAVRPVALRWRKRAAASSSLGHISAQTSARRIVVLWREHHRGGADEASERCHEANVEQEDRRNARCRCRE